MRVKVAVVGVGIERADVTVLDLFAGPGGWDCAAVELGVETIGVEHDASACATRRAAGHLTVRADVAAFPLGHLPRVTGLIASPPCQTFSAAGNRSGIGDLGRIITHVRSCITGWHPAPDFDDPRTGLVLEPLRYACELVPDWIALEQVPDVVPVWEAYRFTLQALGWSVWCGILNAADYGVPQTRRRAILMAHRRHEVSPPEPTHCKGGASTLLGELLPWVSMAEALGWCDGMELRQQRGEGMIERHGERPSRGAAEPAFTIGAGVQRQKLVVRGNNTIAGGPLAERGIDEPAMTVGSRADLWTVRTGANSMVTGREGSKAGDGDVRPYERSMNRPAPTVDGKAGSAWILDRRQTGAPTLDTSAVPAPTLTAAAIGKGVWTLTRPATTVQGDPRLAPPGHRDREGGEPQFGTDALDLTITDALRLQSFPADYPVQGNKGKKFEQIGNAIPPRLARAVLASLVAYGDQKQGETP